MTALHGPEINFAQGKQRGRGKKPVVKRNLNTGTRFEPRYVLVNGREVWRPRSYGWPDIPGDRSGART